MLIAVGTRRDCKVRLMMAYDGFDTIGTVVIVSELVPFVALIVFSLSVVNVASRSALYSGAFGEVAVPTSGWKSASSKFFAAALGGLMLKNDIIEYYDDLDGRKDEGSHGKGEVHKTLSRGLTGAFTLVTPNVLGSSTDI